MFIHLFKIYRTPTDGTEAVGCMYGVCVGGVRNDTMTTFFHTVGKHKNTTEILSRKLF